MNCIRFYLDANARLIWGTKRRQFKVEAVVDICENGLAYDGTLVIGAVAEIVELIHGEDAGDFISTLQELQKGLRYGLASFSAVALYEMGFADRVVSTDLVSLINLASSQKQAMREAIKQSEQEIRTILGQYPSYFTEIFESLIV